MNKIEYSAGATKHGFWFAEFRTVIELLLAEYSLQQIKAKNTAENIMNASSTERSKTIFTTVSRRISGLDSSFYTLFQKGDISTQKLINLVSIMKADRLFFEFMYEVFREKLVIGNETLSDSDFRIFFKNKQIQSEKVAGWTDASLNRLARTYKSYLMESGLASRDKNEKIIYRPILDIGLEHTLKEQNLSVYIDAFTGVR